LSEFILKMKRLKGLELFLAFITPLVLLFALGQHSTLAMLLLLGVCVSFLLQRFKQIKSVFLVLFAFILFGLDFPIYGGSQITLPTEPLAAILFIMVLFEFYREKEFLIQIIKQPISIGLLLLLFIWMASSITSSMPTISFKYTLVNTVFLVGAVGGSILLLKKYNFDFRHLYLLSILPLLFFGLYSIYTLLPYHFNPGAAPLIAQPFFKDHTIYSASIALFVFPLLLWPIYNPKSNKNYLISAIGVLLLVSLFISSSRAAWLSIIVSGLFIGFIYFGGKAKHLFLIGIAALTMLWFNSKSIENTFLINPYSSSETDGSLQDQALSVTNVNSDVSNIERLNRWRCALRMGMDKPLTGFGPATFPFQYLVYQRESEMTYISVTNPFNTILGRGGSAHSEYLLLLSESGWIGFITWMGLQFIFLFSFFKIWNSALTLNEKKLSLVMYISLLTYTIHSLFNNYLGNAAFSIAYWTTCGGLLFYSVRATDSPKHD